MYAFYLGWEGNERTPDMMDWIVTNEVPFFAVFSAMIGCGIAAMFALAALADFAVAVWRKFTQH